MLGGAQGPTGRQIATAAAAAVGGGGPSFSVGAASWRRGRASNTLCAQRATSLHSAPRVATFASRSRAAADEASSGSQSSTNQAAADAKSSSGGGDVVGGSSSVAQARRASAPSRSSGSNNGSNSSSSSKKPLPIIIDADSFPSILREPHPILDRHTTITSSPKAGTPYRSSVTFFNTPKLFPPSPPTAASMALSSQSAETGDEVDSATYLETVTPLRKAEITGLQQHLLSLKRVVKMTGKGKNARMQALVVAGNGRGLVGIGEGKDENAGKAANKAFHAAVKNMDYVERFNGHTIPAEVRGKWSSTEVMLRPRPQGFGLQVPPVVHRVARACGITDLSASILGSTNARNVARATLQVLWGGSAPLGLGDGLGGEMRRRDRGSGMRTVADIELMRGRRLREIQWPSRR